MFESRFRTLRFVSIHSGPTDNVPALSLELSAAITWRSSLLINMLPLILPFGSKSGTSKEKSPTNCDERLPLKWPYLHVYFLIGQLTSIGRVTARGIGSRVTRVVSGLAMSNNFLKIFHPWVEDRCRHAYVLLGIRIYRAWHGFRGRKFIK